MPPLFETMKIFRISMILASCLIFTGCPFYTETPPEYEFIHRDHYVEAYYDNVQEIFLKFDSISSSIAVCPRPLSDDNLVSANQGNRDFYDSLCIKHNDINYNEMCRKFSNMRCYPTFLCFDLLSVNVTSFSDYDLEHPAGSSLNDIVRYMSFSPKEFLDRGSDSISDISNTSTFFGRRIGRWHLIQNANQWSISQPDFHYTYSPVEKYINELKPSDMVMPSLGDPSILCVLYFAKRPAKPGKYTIIVELKADNGQVLSGTLEVSF